MDTVLDLELDFDPQSVCRICLSSEHKLHNLFARTMVDGYLTAVPDMIHACLGLSVNASDRLPAKLCSICKTDVTQFYIFKQKSARTDQLLRGMIPPPVDEQKPQLLPIQKPDAELLPVATEKLNNITVARESAIVAKPEPAAEIASEATRSIVGDLLSILADEQPTSEGVAEPAFKIAQHHYDEDEDVLYVVPSSAEDDNNDDEDDADAFIVSQDEGNYEEDEDLHLEEEHLTDDCDDISIAMQQPPSTDEEASDAHEHESASTSVDIGLVDLAECPAQCGFYGSIGDLNAHLRTEHDLFMCPDCGLTCSIETGLQIHSRTCPESRGKQRKRKKTFDETDTDSLLPATSETDPGDKDDTEDGTQSTISQQPPTKRPKQTQKRAKLKAKFMQCHECDKVFTNQQRFDRHTRMHDMIDVLNEYIEFHPCHVCRLIFPYVHDLKQHQQHEHGLRRDDDAAADAAPNKSLVSGLRNVLQPADEHDKDDGYTDYQFLDDDGYESGEYKCGVCAAAFATSQETKYHLVNHLERFECPLAECGCQYDRFGYFAMHITVKHIHGEANSCQHCGAEHATFDALRAHINAACPEKKFPCTHCDKMFYSLNAQRNHLQWSKGKRHECTECGKTFVQRGELTIHKRIHSDERPYVCTICGKAFKTSSMRMAHMDTHIQGKTFSCPICHAMLQTRSCYRNHMARHAKGKQQECGYCQKRFYTKWHLRQHVTTMHEKKATANNDANVVSMEAYELEGSQANEDDDGVMFL